MKRVFALFIALYSLFVMPLFADWSEKIMSVGVAKHWTSDDRIVHLKGEIREVYGSEGFLLADDTGKLHVHLTNRSLQDYRFFAGQIVEVRGRIEREHRHWDIEANAVKLHDGTVVGHY